MHTLTHNRKMLCNVESLWEILNNNRLIIDSSFNCARSHICKVEMEMVKYLQRGELMLIGKFLLYFTPRNLSKDPPSCSHFKSGLSYLILKVILLEKANGARERVRGGKMNKLIVKKFTQLPVISAKIIMKLY